jgi:putative Ca2+/H+ antiporter (TMEM165/GDT1 family)
MQKKTLLLLLLISTVFLNSVYGAEEPAADGDAQAAVKSPKKGMFTLFTESFSSIVVSELGDKTFFIAAIMAMRYNRMAVLAGALLALFLMTGISTAFGTLVPILLPPHITHIAITVLFFFFGVKLLYDAYNHTEEESSERSEVEIELNEVHNKLVSSQHKHHEPVIQYSENTSLNNTSANSDDIEAKSSTPVAQDTHKNAGGVASKLVFWQALTLTFLGEWGDRSQITTIALAVEGNAYVVFVGSFLGHVLCTSLAVLGGKFLAKKISEKTVSIAGGVLFLLFGIHNLFLKA